MVNLTIFLRYSDILNSNNLKPYGISDFTASTSSDAVPHRRLWRNNIFLVSACPVKCRAYFSGAVNLKIAQLRTELKFDKRFKNLAALYFYFISLSSHFPMYGLA